MVVISRKYSDIPPLVNRHLYWSRIDLKKRGWSAHLMRIFLKNPDKVSFKEGTKYRRPCHFYLRKSIQKIESSGAFAERKRSTIFERRKHNFSAASAADQTKYYTVRDLKPLGWTDTLIRAFLGDPEKIEGRGKKRHGLRLYSRSRVNSISKKMDVSSRLKEVLLFRKRKEENLATAKKQGISIALRRLSQVRGRVPRREGYKWCPRCDKLLPMDDFSWRAGRTKKKYSYCKPCCLQYAHLYRMNASAKDLYWESNMRHRWNLSASEYKEILAIQKNVCAICWKPPGPGARKMHIDHCHKTLRIRGLLCGSCNWGLGQFNDDVRVMRRAIQYLLASLEQKIYNKIGYKHKRDESDANKTSSNACETCKRAFAPRKKVPEHFAATALQRKGPK